MERVRVRLPSEIKELQKNEIEFGGNTVRARKL